MSLFELQNRYRVLISRIMAKVTFPGQEEEFADICRELRILDPEFLKAS